MLIIIEGCDGTGKTTLADKLAQSLGAIQIHFGAELAGNTKIFDLVDRLIEMSRTENIVVDRFIHGQFVYQDPGERVLSLKDLENIEHKLMTETHTLLFLVEADADTIMERIRERGEDTSGFDPYRLLRKYRWLYARVSKMHPIVVKGDPKWLPLR